MSTNEFKSDNSSQTELSYEDQLHCKEKNSCATYNSTSYRDLCRIPWLPDQDYRLCTLCTASFNKFRRKHHCRQCGTIVCGDCSKGRILLAGFPSKQRVCSICHKTPRPFIEKLRQWLVRNDSYNLGFKCRGSQWWDCARKSFGACRPTVYSDNLYGDMKTKFKQLYLEEKCDEMNSISYHIDALKKDVKRTFGHIPETLAPNGRPLVDETNTQGDTEKWETSLTNVLGSFICFNSNVGYCQGMSFVAAMLLFESSWNEELSFWLFVALIERYDMNSLYSPNLPDLGLRFFQLDELCAKFYPRLRSHLTDRSIHPSMYASSWFLTLFANFRVLGTRSTARVFDLFFCDGWKAIFRVCLAILRVAQEKIVYHDSPDDILDILQSLKMTFPILSNPTNLIDLAMLNKISNSMLRDLQDEYEQCSTSMTMTTD